MSSSKTFWFNAFNVVGALGVYHQSPEVFTPFVAVSWLTLMGIGNILLRRLTKHSVTF